MAELRSKKYRPFPRVAKVHVAGDVDEADAEATEAEEVADTSAAGGINDYDYLLSMSLSSLTREKARRIDSVCGSCADVAAGRKARGRSRRARPPALDPA